jgi:hypothetical protein
VTPIWSIFQAAGCRSCEWSGRSFRPWSAKPRSTVSGEPTRWSFRIVPRPTVRANYSPHDAPNKRVLTRAGFQDFGVRNGMKPVDRRSETVAWHQEPMDRVIILSDNDRFSVMAIPLQMLVGRLTEGEP